MVKITGYNSDECEYIEVDVDLDDSNNKDEILNEFSDSDLESECVARGIRVNPNPINYDVDVVVDKLKSLQPYELHDVLCDVVGISRHDIHKESIIKEWIDNALSTRK